MSRSGYTSDYGNDWELIMYRGAVKSAIRGRRGQAFLRDLRDTLAAMPEKELIAGSLVEGSEVCAIGSLAVKRKIDVSKLDPEDAVAVANLFNIAPALAREVVFINDEYLWLHYNDDPNSIQIKQERHRLVSKWVDDHIKEAA